MTTPQITADAIRDKLLRELPALEVTVADTSGGCGSAFEVQVVSNAFTGRPLLQRHRLINECLRAEMAHIHALSITKAAPPPPVPPTS